MGDVTRSISPGNRDWRQLDKFAQRCGFKEAKSEFFQYAVDVLQVHIPKQKRQERIIIFLGVLISASIILQVLQLVWNT